MPGKIGLIALESAKKMGSRIDRILSEWRNGEHFLITPECPRFSSGEGKCVLVSVQSCGQNRCRGGYPYPPRTPRAKNGVRGRETPSPSSASPYTPLKRIIIGGRSLRYLPTAAIRLFSFTHDSYAY